MNAEQRFISFIQSQGGYIPFPDEGVLNAVFDGEIFCIPLRFNAQTMIFAFPYKKMCYARGVKSFYTPEEVKNARKDPVMVHFTSNFYYPERPWIKDCRHPYAETYLAYRNLTPWRDKPLWEDVRPLIRKLYTEFCRSVPMGVAVWTAHVISLYLTPLKHRYKKRRAINMMKKNLSSGGGTPEK